MNKAGKPFLRLAFLPVAIGAAACSGGDVREEQREQAPIVRTEVQEGNTEVTTQSREVRTVQKNVQLPTVSVTETKIDINRMEPEHFMALGLPQEQANRIVEHREDKGRFASVDELRQVEGLDMAWFNSIRNQLGTAPTG